MKSLDIPTNHYISATEQEDIAKHIRVGISVAQATCNTSRLGYPATGIDFPRETYQKGLRRRFEENVDSII